MNNDWCVCPTCSGIIQVTVQYYRSFSSNGEMFDPFPSQVPYNITVYCENDHCLAEGLECEDISHEVQVIVREAHEEKAKEVSAQ